jgi:hypothetical protein
MRILIATSRDRGNIDRKINQAPEEDILTPVYPCGNGDAHGDCVCRSGFAGLLSDGYTVTATVVDRPDMNESSLHQIARRQVEAELLESPDTDEQRELNEILNAWIVDHVIEIGQLTAELPLGTIVGRRDGKLVANIDGIRSLSTHPRPTRARWTESTI